MERHREHECCQNQKCVLKTHKHTKPYTNGHISAREKKTTKNWKFICTKTKFITLSGKELLIFDLSLFICLFEQFSSKSHICIALRHYWTLKIRNSIHYYYYEKETFSFFIRRAQLRMEHPTGRVLPRSFFVCCRFSRCLFLFKLFV